MKIPRKALDWAAIVLVLAGAGAASLRFSPTALAFGMKLTGKAPYCSWGRLWSIRAENAEHARIEQALRAGTRLVRTEGELTLWQTPRGAYWLPRGDTDLIPFLLAEQERKLYGEGKLGVQPGDVVLDCGAHVGVFTREALRAGARKVVAIEPSPVTLECLRRNLAKETGAGQAVIYPKGVWHSEETLSFRINSVNSGRDAVVNGEIQEGDIQIPVTTIDKLASELALERVDFIKMDIEGAERHAVAGARATISRFRPRMALCTYHLPDDPVKIVEAVRAARRDYRVSCGPCGLGHFDSLTPETYFFW